MTLEHALHACSSRMHLRLDKTAVMQLVHYLVINCIFSFSCVIVRVWLRNTKLIFDASSMPLDNRESSSCAGVSRPGIRWHTTKYLHRRGSVIQGLPILAEAGYVQEMTVDLSLAVQVDWSAKHAVDLGRQIAGRGSRWVFSGDQGYDGYVS